MNEHSHECEIRDILRILRGLYERLAQERTPGPTLMRLIELIDSINQDIQDLSDRLTP